MLELRLLDSRGTQGWHLYFKAVRRGSGFQFLTGSKNNIGPYLYS